MLVISVVFGWCQETPIYPSSLATMSSYASTSSLTSLRTKDQSGTQDNWGRYVEFYGTVMQLPLSTHLLNYFIGTSSIYAGTFSFPVVNPSSVVSYRLNVNFKGSQKNVQIWRFDWYIPSSNSYVFAGDNAGVGNWVWR